MTELSTATDHVDYEGFEIHVVPGLAPGSDTRYTYTGYVCHPGANPALPGHAVPFHADGEKATRASTKRFRKPCTSARASSTARIRTCPFCRS